MHYGGYYMLLEVSGTVCLANAGLSFAAESPPMYIYSWTFVDQFFTNYYTINYCANCETIRDFCSVLIHSTHERGVTPVARYPAYKNVSFESICANVFKTH